MFWVIVRECNETSRQNARRTPVGDQAHDSPPTYTILPEPVLRCMIFQRVKVGKESVDSFSEARGQSIQGVLAAKAENPQYSTIRNKP